MSAIYGRCGMNRHPEIASKINQTGRCRDQAEKTA
jgi:hypothetical protein